VYIVTYFEHIFMYSKQILYAQAIKRLNAKCTINVAGTIIFSLLGCRCYAYSVVV